MVEEPEKAVEEWLEAGAKRIIIHYEAIFNPGLRFHEVNPNEVWEEIRNKCVARGAELMLAINPETPVEMLSPLLSKISAFQVLAVNPGPAGQIFLMPSLNKIKFLRGKLPNAKIEVDGGINPETARLAKAAGASILACGTYILKNSDPDGAYHALQSI